MMNEAASSSNISAYVVVCCPFSLASLTSKVGSSSAGSMALINVLLPTPLCPATSVTLPARAALTSSMPVPFSAEVMMVR